MVKGIIGINREVALMFQSNQYDHLYNFWAEGDQLEIFLDPKSIDGSNVRVWNTSLPHIILNVKVLGLDEAKELLD